MKRILTVLLAVSVLFVTGITTAYGLTDTPSIKLKYKSESIHKGKTLKNKLIGATGGVKWISSNKKGATVSGKGTIKAKAFGKCTITAKYKGKAYKCKIKVVRRKPNFDAKIVDVDINKDGKNYVKVKIKNYSGKSLTILQKAKYNDFTDVTYSVKLTSEKGFTIKPKKTKTVTFYNYGKYDLYNHAGRKDPDIFAFLSSSIKYNIKFDGKKYSAHTYWYEEEEDYYYDSVYGDDIPSNADQR